MRTGYSAPNQRCQHGGRPCPRVIQAIPLDSVHAAAHRRSCLPSLIVGGLVLGVTVLEGLVPTVAGAIAAVLP